MSIDPPSPIVLGQAAALLAALTWAIAVPMHEIAGKRIAPGPLNLFKSVVAAILMLLWTACSGALFETIPLRALILLSVSGFFGLAIGDTLFLRALNNLGTRRTLLTMLLVPPLTSLLACLFIDEKLSWRIWLGIVITLGGVGWVITERTENDSGSLKEHRSSIVIALLMVLCWGVSTFLSRAALAGTDVDPMMSAMIRMIVCTLFLLIWCPLRKQDLPNSTRILLQGRLWRIVVPAATIGTFLGIWFQQEALARVEAGIIQTLLSMSPIFAIGVCRLQGEKVSWRAILGALIAFGGIALISLSKGS